MAHPPPLTHTPTDTEPNDLTRASDKKLRWRRWIGAVGAKPDDYDEGAAEWLQVWPVEGTLLALILKLKNGGPAEGTSLLFEKKERKEGRPAQGTPL